MSATRDPSQKTTFVYSNLYQLYRKGKEAAQNAEVPAQDSKSATSPAVESQSSYVTLGYERAAAASEASSKNVLKARDLKKEEVSSYNPPEFIAKRVSADKPMSTPTRVEKPAVLRADPAIRSLKENLKSLNDLHARLRFMLQEIEDLVKE